MTSIVERLLGRQPQQGQAHEGCCGGHGKSGAAAHGGAEKAGSGCCGGHEHDHHGNAVTGVAREAPVESAGARS